MRHHDIGPDLSMTAAPFSRDPSGLPEATGPEALELGHGDTLHLPSSQP